MGDLAKYFLYLGLTGFGGPLVLIQHMRQHYAEKHGKISPVEFDQAFALIKAMPGPIAFQMAVFLGHRFFRFRGGITAGVCLLIPSFIMMILFGYFYDSFVHAAFVHPVLDGLLYAASAIILLSLKNLVLSNSRVVLFWGFVVMSLLLSWFQVVPEPVLIVGFGLLALLSHKITSRLYLFSPGFFFVDWQLVYQLFKICLYAGAFVFGTGFALLPVLKTSLVDVHQFLSLKEFNDGVIFGQMTPGPITITATFLGYKISGFAGASIATLGIFLIPFIHIVTWFPLAIGWLSKQKWINRFLMGATAAVVGSIVTTLIKMNLESYSQLMFWVLFSATLLLLLKKPKTSILLIFLVAGLLNLGFTALSTV